MSKAQVEGAGTCCRVAAGHYTVLHGMLLSVL